jgi:general secretion pathway protein J
VINRGREYGFTLLEIMVALTIFVILATITSTALYHAFDIKTRIAAQMQRINQLQQAITFIKRDTEQMLTRSIRGNEMRVFPPFIGQAHYLEFTRSGIVSPEMIKPHSTLKRVAFLCKEKQLIRRSWEVLDMPERKDYHDKILLDNLEQCAFAYIAHNQQILPIWREYAVQQNQREETLPSAIQLTLVFHQDERMSMLFIVPEALYAD